MKLTGIEIRNYRSIGNEPVILNPWKKCNILIGQNSAGKSNVIRAIEKVSNAFHKRTPNVNALIAELNRDEVHGFDQKNQFSFKVFYEGERGEGNDTELMDLSTLAFFEFYFSNRQGQQGLYIEDNNLTSITNFRVANNLNRKAIGSYWEREVNPDVLKKNFLENGYRYFSRYFNGAFPTVQIIPVFRQIQPGERYNVNGARLIQLLGQYQHPQPSHESDRIKFDKIEEFARRLLHWPDATLEVTHDNEKLLINNDGLRLELNSHVQVFMSLSF